MHQMCAPFNLQLPIIACYGWLLRTALHLFLPSKRRHWHSYIFIDGKTFSSLSLSNVFSLACSRHDSLVLIVYFCVISDLKLATRIYCAIVFGFFSLSLCVLPAEIGKMTRGLHTSSSNRTRYDINPTDEWKKEKKQDSNPHMSAIFHIFRYVYAFAMAMTIPPVYQFSTTAQRFI